MITLRLGNSLLAALYLATGTLVFVGSTAAAIALLSWPAAVCAALSAVVVVRLARLLVRRWRGPPDEVVVVGGAFGAAVTTPAFLTFARHSSGAWSQRGVVMLAEHGGVFLPMGGRSHLLLGAMQAMFVSTARFADVSFDVGGTSPEAMADAARRHGGFTLGPDWTLNADQRWLHRDAADGIVVLAHAPTGAHASVFRRSPAPAEADVRRVVRVVVLAALAVCVALVTVGVVGARWTGDPEILGGFAAFAAMIGGATVFAVVVALRRVG